MCVWRAGRGWTEGKQRAGMAAEPKDVRDLCSSEDGRF